MHFSNFGTAFILATSDKQEYNAIEMIFRKSGQIKRRNFKMKKILAIVLALVMMLSFAACSSAETVKFAVSDLEGNVVYEFEVELTENATAGVLLEEGLKANGIDYEQIDSTMIQRIGELEQDSVNWTVWWSVYVNGEYGQVGLWEQPVAANDFIEIKLENTF